MQPVQYRRLLFIVAVVGWTLLSVPTYYDEDNSLPYAQDHGFRRLANILNFTKVYRGDGRHSFFVPIDEGPKHVKYGMKCCSDDANGPNWSKTHFGAKWCPFSYKFSTEECHVLEAVDFLNFPHANEFCASKGGRLCTANELKGKCAMGNGCGLDLKLVWTSLKSSRKTS
mmetsp:Transcript_32821/g.55822  ORF Transcript_32821/g.55822 Transcript_32821/m.55822 type:complete len:170 (-) Transcript_32821:93-602(-)